jgi:hypothetical protein
MILGLTLATFIVLLVALVIGMWRAKSDENRATAGREGFFVHLWRALHPNFEPFDSGRATTQTLNLLIAAMFIFAAAIIVWAAGAGVMRTAYLYAVKPDGIGDGFGATCKVWIKCESWQAWFFVAFVLLFEVARAVGGVLAIGLGAGLAGAIVGFIFGIPRPISAAEAPPAEAGGTALPPGVTPRQAGNAWQLSTNLTQISDWLTKVIVGVGLVEAKTALEKFQGLSYSAGGWLFDLRHGSPAVIAAIMLGCAVFGFLFAYLYAELIVSRLIVAVDREMAHPSDEAREKLLGIDSFSEALVPRISRSSHPGETTHQPNQDQIRAALQYLPIGFDELVSRSNLTFDDILNWSRARALLNDYREAARGYIHLLGMTAR